LIDADPDLSRSSFVQSVLRNTEVNGELHRVFPAFYIDTIVGHPAFLGSYPGWNIEEFKAVVDANPDADFPFGQGFSKQSLLWSLVMYGMDNFIDWHTGTVSFDSDEFIGYLEFANTLPDEIVWDDELTDVGLMRSGRQIIRATSLDNFFQYQMYKAIFGGELVFKGYPAENRNGSTMQPAASFAITTKCHDVEGAWSFIRTFLMEDWQYDQEFMGFPTNQNAFDRVLRDAKVKNNRSPDSIAWDDFRVQWTPMTEEDTELFMALIDSLSGTVSRDEPVWTIIREGAAGYFNGQVSVQDAVRVIQNRVSIYVAEQR